jgi:hypothetical protein
MLAMLFTVIIRGENYDGYYDNKSLLRLIGQEGFSPRSCPLRRHKEWLSVFLTSIAVFKE